MLIDREIGNIRNEARNVNRKDIVSIRNLQKRLVQVRMENVRRRDVAESKAERDVCMARFHDLDSLSGLLRSMCRG